MGKSKKAIEMARFDQKMKRRNEQFNKLWFKIVDDVNAFVEKYPETDMTYNLRWTESFADDLSLSGGWIYDRIEGRNPLNSKRSLSKKIRKLLGYNS